LHTITVGLAKAGASVHSARVLTEHGKAIDRFELTDQRGDKLDDATKEAIRAAVQGGVDGRGRLRRMTSGWGQRRDAVRSRSGTGRETRPS
jgi:hypothetical protein